MGRRIEVARQEGWVEPILNAARDAAPGDTIVVHSVAQQDFLRMELAEIGKSGVRTINSGRRSPYAYPFDVRGSSESANKIVQWLNLQAHAARQRI